MASKHAASGAGGGGGGSKKPRNKHSNSPSPPRKHGGRRTTTGKHGGASTASPPVPSAAASSLAETENFRTAPADEDGGAILDAEAAAGVEMLLGHLSVSDRKVIKGVQDKAVRFVDTTAEARRQLDWKEREDGQRYKFHHLCFAGDEPGQVKMLIQDRLAPLAARTDVGQTPLHWAVLGGHLQACRRCSVVCFVCALCVLCVCFVCALRVLCVYFVCALCVVCVCARVRQWWRHRSPQQTHRRVGVAGDDARHHRRVYYTKPPERVR